MSATIAKRFGWTGWLLVLVYFGALTAISGYIAHWFLVAPELSFYEVFIKVIVSTLILFILAQVYSILRDKDSTSKWWSRALKILSIVFGFISLAYLGIGLGLLFSVNEFHSDSDFNKFSPELQQTIIQNSNLFGVLFTGASIIAIVATIGLVYRRKFGWYAAVSLVLMQIIAITGLLDKERATRFILLPEIMTSRLITTEEIHQIETVFVPVVMSGVFAMLVANIVVVTFLTLPRILVIFRMPPDILASRMGKGH